MLTIISLAHNLMTTPFPQQLLPAVYGSISTYFLQLQHDDRKAPQTPIRVSIIDDERTARGAQDNQMINMNRFPSTFSKYIQVFSQRISWSLTAVSSPLWRSSRPTTEEVISVESSVKTAV